MLTCFFSFQLEVKRVVPGFLLVLKRVPSLGKMLQMKNKLLENYLVSFFSSSWLEAMKAYHTTHCLVSMCKFFSIQQQTNH